MRFDIITIFPEMLASVFSGGVVKKALEKKKLEVWVHDLRDFAQTKHRQVDDRPYGGGEGMVFKPEPIFKAVESLKQDEESLVYLLSPSGLKFDSSLAERLARVPQVILICGRYEGVDERVSEHLVDAELSVGDYVLTGGEPAAWVIVDAVARFIPGVVGKEASVRQDSFARGLLDYPHYTRPREFRGMKVPAVLFSGDHARIEAWRRKKALEKTWARRPDLIREQDLTAEDKKILDSIIKKGKDHEPD
ncbi:MAG: tRNA (guanosine(37)-N1)-methyltransferase TrmD [Candidatus Aminicenantales bacterium]